MASPVLTRIGKALALLGQTLLSTVRMLSQSKDTAMPVTENPYRSGHPDAPYHGVRDGEGREERR